MTVVAWLKKWWKWILFPIGIAVVLLSRKTKVVVASPELEGHAKLETELNTESMRQKEQAAVARDFHVRVADEVYEESVIRAQREAEKKVKTVGSDPVVLNDYLKRVGRDVRRAKK